MQRNFLEIFFYPEDTQEAQDVHKRGPVGPTRHQSTQGPPCVPWWIVGPIGAPSTASQLYKYSNILETLGESTKHNSSHRKFQNHEIQSRGLLRHSAGDVKDHVHHHPCPSE